ncbi:MAG: tRNA (adenosine(37)-N6)-threonylcarbamoyltransferase complex transferase subunit TsaD [Polyangiaceae bacterium]
MRVLGIETSCDETAAAVVTDEGLVLSDVVRSQVEIHAPYGGVVPEVAARDHATWLPRVIDEALARAGLRLAEVDGIAVTARPGLVGALLVGVQAAKGLAWAADKPLVGVDHLVGHLLAVFLRRPGDPPAAPPAYPFVALLASGGHTAIYRVEGASLDRIQELGGTRDDAAGEAFDKFAKLVGLGYPGGPRVDALAATGNPDASADWIPALMAHRDSLEFSFSGLKTAVARRVERDGVPSGEALADLAAGYQRAIVRTLATKTVRAARLEGVRTIVVGGGVAANKGLRAELARQAEREGLRLVVPPFASCTDNAAMIAYAGVKRLEAGARDAFDLEPAPRTELARVTRKGGGKRPKPPTRTPKPGSVP